MPRELTNKSNYSYSLSGNSGKGRKDIMGFFSSFRLNKIEMEKKAKEKGKEKGEEE